MAEVPTDAGEQQPRRFGRWRPPKADADGKMALIEHLKELRYRVTVSAIAVVVVSIAAAFFYEQLVRIILDPYYTARDQVLATRAGADLQLANSGVVGPFTLAVMAVVLTGIICSCPVWLYQLWAFIAPGLLSKEKKYAMGFIAAAIPLFLLGIFTGYWVWPKGIAVMLSFTPDGLDIMNLLDMAEFLALEVKIILVFGLSFLLPVVLIALNMAGVVKGYQLAEYRRFVIFGTVVFAAVATPSTDPFSMLALCVPMSLLYFVAERIAIILDKRKGITKESVAEWHIDVSED
ncbi:MAG: twin-arginine translocase subunit TatC [Arachnia propionica]|nr:MAG: twin-arginine translocase subunit TatC [Arachnia propionica]